jgi:hypothetical protein
MAKMSGPDPRFDPRFQRGYDGPEPDAPSTPAMPSPLEVGRSSPREAGIPSPSDSDAARGTADLAAPAGDSAVEGLWAPPRRNPFALALLLGSLAMIAVGVWFFWSVFTASSFPDGNDRAAQTFNLVQQELTPALFIVGLLGVITWLVLGSLAASGKRD